MKNELKTPADAQKEATDYHSQMVATVYSGYQRQLSRNEALDFDDLIMTTINLFACMISSRILSEQIPIYSCR